MGFISPEVTRFQSASQSKVSLSSDDGSECRDFDRNDFG